MTHTVLVTGASGFVGSKVIPELLDEGFEVVAGARNPKKLDQPWVSRVRTATCDVLKPETLETATKGVDCVIYLVHSMTDHDFEAEDARGASNMVHACAQNGVSKIVYLTGIVPKVDEDDLSPHIRSRYQVEKIFMASSVTTIALRAAIIVGDTSTSFGVFSDLVQKFPLVPSPSWLNHEVEPIAIDDVIRCIVAAVKASGPSRHVDIGCGIAMSYLQLLRRFTRQAKMYRFFVPLPPVPTALAAPIIGRLTSKDTKTAEELISSIKHSMVCQSHGPLDELLGQSDSASTFVSIDDALREAYEASK